MSVPVVCGIFVGGQARRMGGAAKGLLRAFPDGPAIVEQLRQNFVQACPNGEVVLVGAHPSYQHLGLAALMDRPAGIGPMGGLQALLDLAQARSCMALALACDMPRVSEALIARLLTEHPAANAVAPKPNGYWEPLCARYAPKAALAATQACIHTRRYGLFNVLDAVTATALELTTAEQAQLVDWDTPQDIDPA